MLELAITQLLNGSAASPRGVQNTVKNAFRVSASISTNDTSKDTLAGEVLGHGLLDGLHKGERLPTYIPGEKFADALLDCLRRRSHEPSPTAGGLLKAVRELERTKAAQALETLIVASGDDISLLRKQIITWYDATMERVSGWYTRAVRWRTFLFGLAIAVSFQIDAIRITQELMQNATLRSDLVTAAEARVRNGSTENPELAKTAGELTGLKLPIGWSACSISSTRLPDANGNSTSRCDPGKWSLSNVLLMVLGWLIVALAVTQGAPFWFDLINRLVAVRGAGRKPEAKSDAKADPSQEATDSTVNKLWTTPSTADGQAPAGMTEDDVRNVQATLGVPRTAVIDLDTRNAVRAMQRRLGRVADGALDKALAQEILRSKL
jgi:hypothetical protein